MNRRVTIPPASRVREDLSGIGRELVESAGKLGEIYLALSRSSVPSVEQERALRRTLREVTDSTAQTLRIVLDLQRLAARLELNEGSQP